MVRQPAKQYVLIETVNPKTRKLEGRLKDGAQVAIGVYEISRAFRWPKVGEYWSVVNELGTWMLGDRLEVDPTVPAPIENLEPGQMRLDSDQVKDASGRDVIAIEGEAEARLDGSIPTWDQADQAWKPGAAGSGSGDKNFVYAQGVASQYWGTPVNDPSATITHNLGKRSAVTVVDSAGTEIVVDVQYIDDDTVKIQLSSPASGSAYFN